MDVEGSGQVMGPQRMSYRPQPLIWPLQTLFLGGPWSPGLLPPTTENWLGVTGAAPEKTRRRLGSLNVTMGKDREIES